MMTRVLKTFAWTLLLAPLLFAAAPAEGTGLCSSTCSPTVSCSLACYDTGGPNFFSNCGDYGNCQDIQPCEDPKSVTYRSETTLENEQVTATVCHTGPWYWDPGSLTPSYFYDYLTLTYRKTIIRVTEYCDGTIAESVATSNTYTAFCSRYTGGFCGYNAQQAPSPICTY